MPRRAENVGTARVVLTLADLAGIETALEQIKVAGDRYSAQRQRFINRQAVCRRGASAFELVPSLVRRFA
ncbi:hypothetical protein [Paraburkholderia atlantica]|uniref:hypothetical protein n=1 Tax=Paraburkholderia atlantica TaxID=2654982 RepID=UPI0001BF31FE|nr:hypothetical protein [Paraburkholderia atlantica]MBB5505272.1 hypothetical protein [Paraburkholderia atlantica]